MESVPERHAAPRELQAAPEVAHELAREREPGEAGARGGAISRERRRAYRGALRRLRDGLAGRLLDDATLAGYHPAARFEAGHSPAAAGQVVAAVRFYAKLGDQPSPAGPATGRVLVGFRREGLARGRGQVVGVRWEQAATAAAVAASSGGSVRGLRNAALLAVMSGGLLRVSGAAALQEGQMMGRSGVVLGLGV